METQTPYSVNPETIFSGHWIVAQQGMGKTNLLLHMLSSDLKQNASIIIMDSKGELTRPIRKLSLGERLIVLDPKQPFGINPLDASTPDLTHTIEQLLYIFGVLLDA